MTVYEDLVVDDKEEQAAVGTFNRINVDDAATIVPIFEDGSLLMVENYRHAVSTNLLELPGGLVRRNEQEEKAGEGGEEREQPFDTAKRELLEETGYASDNMEFINWFYTWPGRATQRNFVFMAKGLKEVKFEQKLEEFEYTKVCKVDREQVKQELKNGRIKSAVTLSALLYGYFL
ncbi:MAG TPA: NUDIX hydrolase [Nitrososphaeraceae archaeon]|nr:NUDIX hydrolase [Nitrososphaeraceae archaeon]